MAVSTWTLLLTPSTAQCILPETLSEVDLSQVMKHKWLRHLNEQFKNKLYSTIRRTKKKEFHMGFEPTITMSRV